MQVFDRVRASLLIALSAVQGHAVSTTVPAHSPSQRSSIELTEAYSLQVPDSFVLAGAAASTHGRILLWSLNQSRLILVTDTTMVRLDADVGRGVIAGSFIQGDSVLEVVTSSPPAIVRFTSKGRLVRRRTLGRWADSVALETGAHADGGWVIGAVQGDKSYRVVHVSDAGAKEVTWQLLEATRVRDLGRSFQMTASEGRVLMASHFPPYSVIGITPTGSTAILVAQSALVSRRVIGAPDTSSRWIALPVVVLDTGFIQTFADLNSDRRILTLYTSGFDLVNHVASNVPLGMMTSIPSRRVLVSGRNLRGRVELVVYRWRWVARN